jgi:hypothetical protein
MGPELQGRMGIGLHEDAGWNALLDGTVQLKMLHRIGRIRSWVPLRQRQDHNTARLGSYLQCLPRAAIW